jgi:hypothetical protein
MRNFYPEQLENYDGFSKDSSIENNFSPLDEHHINELNPATYNQQQPYMQGPMHSGYEHQSTLLSLKSRSTPKAIPKPS